MQQSRDLKAFVAQRSGHYFVGRHYLVWCVDATLGGMVFWGVPDEHDVAELSEATAIHPRPGLSRPYDVIVDGRRVESLAASAFEAFARQALRRVAEQRPVLRRHAVIAPPGLIGSVMAGFFPLFGLGDSYRVFRDAGDAFAWLGSVDALAEVERIIVATLGESPTVVALAGWLAAHLHEPTLSNAARALARSSRSLQRELGAAGTSFRRELDRARVSFARTRLADSDDKIATIAHQSGCASESTFSDMFRRVTAETPTAFRARFRSATHHGL